MRPIHGLRALFVLIAPILVTAGTAGGVPAPPVAPCLQGKVVYDGEPPALPDFKNPINAQKDRGHCLKGDVSNPAWSVRKRDKAVANAVVWLKRADGKPFEIPEEEKNRKDVITVDMPHCAFQPHVLVLFPSYRDLGTGEQIKTGQKLKVMNSGPVMYNIHIRGSPLQNPAMLFMMPPKKDNAFEKAIYLRPQSQAITLNCDVHKWMSAYVWAFDHPYAAASKEDGSFQIRSAPAGIEVEVYAWHEANPTFIVDGKDIAGKPTGVLIKQVTLKKGNHTLDIKVKAK